MLRSMHKFDIASGRVLEHMTTHKVCSERMLMWVAGILGYVSSVCMAAIVTVWGRDGTIMLGHLLGTVTF